MIFGSFVCWEFSNLGGDFLCTNTGVPQTIQLPRANASHAHSITMRSQFAKSLSSPIYRTNMPLFAFLSRFRPPFFPNGALERNGKRKQE